MHKGKCKRCLLWLDFLVLPLGRCLFFFFSLTERSYTYKINAISSFSWKIRAGSIRWLFLKEQGLVEANKPFDGLCVKENVIVLVPISQYMVPFTHLYLLSQLCRKGI